MDIHCDKDGNDRGNEGDNSAVVLGLMTMAVAPSIRFMKIHVASEKSLSVAAVARVKERRQKAYLADTHSIPVTRQFLQIKLNI